MTRRRIIVAGIPRSGTSWLAKVLSQAPGLTFYGEPDDFVRVSDAERYFSRLYRRADGDDVRYRRHMERALNGEVTTPFTMSENPGPVLESLPKRLRRRGARIAESLPALYVRERGILVKLVNSSLALDWLQERFPDARVVCVTRYPGGVFASWRRMGWQPEPERLLESESLVEDHLEPYVELIRSAETFWERAGALWGAMNLVVVKQRERNPQRALLQFEWLCENPHTRFRALFDQLALPWTSDTEKFLENSDRPDERPYSVKRRSRDEIDKWKAVVSDHEIHDCRRYAEPFGLPFYPDFQPLASDPLW